MNNLFESFKIIKIKEEVLGIWFDVNIKCNDSGNFSEKINPFGKSTLIAGRVYNSGIIILSSFNHCKSIKYEFKGVLYERDYNNDKFKSNSK